MRLFNVAVVDRDPAVLRSISVVLTRCADYDQMAIQFFANSAEVLDWLSADSCDLLITALELPTIDGQQLTREAKARNPRAQIIVLSPPLTTDQLDELAELGASDFLSKPLDKLLLRDLVEQSMGRLCRWELAARGHYHLSPTSAPPLGRPRPPLSGVL